MKRLRYAFGWFWGAFKKPQIFNLAYLKILEGMANFMKQAAENEHPMKCELAVDFPTVTKLAKINWKEREKVTLLHLWCGVDNVDSPFKRITDLIEENKKLKFEVDELLRERELLTPKP